jgi:hypothetical protein
MRRTPLRGAPLPSARVPALALIIAAAVSVVAIAAAAAGADRWVAAGAVANTTATPNPNCTLIVPRDALSSQGLATPYQLTATDPANGPCNEANSAQTAFVQGAVIDPATGKISVYNPLVIDAGTQPAVAPVVPALPADAVVAVWFGYNGNVLSLQGAGQASAVPSAEATAAAATRVADGPAASGMPDAVLQSANCVAGQEIGGQFSSFTQVGACNAVAFFQAANNAITAGKLQVPQPGIAVDGRPCLTTRSFALIDQDQSDNVTAEYLASPAGQTAQDTSANQQSLGANGTILFNGSDNGLLDFFMDPSLGCSPWTAPDLANDGAPATALPLDELQAARWAGQVRGGGPAALVPENDPMTLDGNGNVSTDKTNTYRSIMDMPSLPAGQSPKDYCTSMEQIQGKRLQQDVNLLMRTPSPAPGTADTLFTFVASRLQASFTNLNCGSFGLANDVSTSVDGNGVVVAACFLNQAAALTPGAGNPMKGMTTCPATAVTGSPSASPTPSASASQSATASGSPSASPSGSSASPSSSPASPAPTSPRPSPTRPSPTRPSPTKTRVPAGQSSATRSPAAQSPAAQPPSVPAPSATVPSATVPTVPAPTVPVPSMSQPVPATTPTLALGPTGLALSGGAHDSGRTFADAGRWPGIGTRWGQPNPRRMWVSAVVTGIWSGVLTVFLSATWCRRVPGTVPV